MVDWDKVCTLIANGGLGVRKLTTFNQALLESGYGIWGRGITIMEVCLTKKF